MLLTPCSTTNYLHVLASYTVGSITSTYLSLVLPQARKPFSCHCSSYYFVYTVTSNTVGNSWSSSNSLPFSYHVRLQTCLVHDIGCLNYAYCRNIFISLKWRKLFNPPKFNECFAGKNWAIYSNPYIYHKRMCFQLCLPPLTEMNKKAKLRQSFTRIPWPTLPFELFACAK